MTLPPLPEPTRPLPHELWKQAAGNREEYVRLMRLHGHIVPRDHPDAVDPHR